jgi:hypothetical protein
MIRSSACRPWRPNHPGRAGDCVGLDQLHHTRGHDHRLPRRHNRTNLSQELSRQPDDKRGHGRNPAPFHTARSYRSDYVQSRWMSNLSSNSDINARVTCLYRGDVSMKFGPHPIADFVGNPEAAATGNKFTATTGRDHFRTCRHKATMRQKV